MITYHSVDATCIDTKNTLEKKNGFFYHLLQILVYLSLPFFFVCVFCIIGINNTALLAVVFLFVFLWPFFKGRIGVVIAKTKKIKDSRRAIRSSSFIYDGFLFIGSPVLREIRKFSALSQSLDCIYNLEHKFNVSAANFGDNWWKEISKNKLVNFLIKKWTDFWFRMSISQDVRTRLGIVSQEVQRISEKVLSNKDTLDILLLAGGTKQDLIMAISELCVKLKDSINNKKINVVCVEPDGRFAIRTSKKLMEQYKVDKNIFVDIFKMIDVEPEHKKTLKDVITQQGYNFGQFDIVVCIGLGDYMYGKKIYQFVKMIDNGNNIITANISGNFIERYGMHILLQWPRMQYLSFKKYKNILTESLELGDRNLKIIRTPNKVFNIGVIEK